LVLTLMQNQARRRPHMVDFLQTMNNLKHLAALNSRFLLYKNTFNLRKEWI
jgi:hypothetical protein